MAPQKVQGVATEYGIVRDSLPQRRRKTKHPWSVWQSGQSITLQRNVHFSCTSAGLVSTIYARARTTNMAVVAFVGLGDESNDPIDDLNYVTFQFFPDRPYQGIARAESDA